MKKQKTILVKDNKNIRNILIQIDVKKQTTSILSSSSAWENLSFLAQALGATAEKCTTEGIDRKEIYQIINDYLSRILTNSPLILNNKEKN